MTSCLWLAAAVAIVISAPGCAPRSSASLAAVRIPAEVLAARLADADRLAARGCYLCLKEAAAAYSSLLDLSNDNVLVTRALEHNLMLALREIELRLPDSGAREAAESLAVRAPSSYATYFAVLDALQSAGADGAYPVLPLAAQAREQRLKLAMELEKEWAVSAMRAYFFLVTALTTRDLRELKPIIAAVLAAHPQDLSLKYRVQAIGPVFSREASRALIGEETGFGEVHLLLGLRGMLDGNLGAAHRELTRARELLPDSASVALTLAGVAMSYARYPEALALYDQVVASSPDGASRLGKAKALSYLTRHEEAIVLLDELLKELHINPGEKYYWRAWNRLRLAQTQPAYDDALAALNAMRNNEVYRLAGIASLGLGRLAEARGHFAQALDMNGADCDSQRYLGDVDAVERQWQPAVGHYVSAVACYEQSLARMAGELPGPEKDISGLSNGLIASLREDMKEAEILRAASARNADLISKSPAFPRSPSPQVRPQ